MTQLGYILALTHGPGGDKLLRTSVQLHLEGSVAADEDACRAMTNLSAAFWAQDTHVEGCQMAKTALDKFLPSLGNEHPDILATKVALARNMTKAGKLSESEQLFREIVSVEASFTGSTKPVGLANSCYGLARVLMMRGFLDEAIELYREVFHARAWSYGWDHRYTLRVCYDLGDCYRKHGQYDDAIAFYQDVVGRLWKIGSDGNSYHPDIDDLESCILELEKQRVKNRVSCSSEGVAGEK
jgi:tetratricopeptide (TPR) repeat protein